MYTRNVFQPMQISIQYVLYMIYHPRTLRKCKLVFELYVSCVNLNLSKSVCVVCYLLWWKYKLNLIKQIVKWKVKKFVTGLRNRVFCSLRSRWWEFFGERLIIIWISKTPHPLLSTDPSQPWWTYMVSMATSAVNTESGIKKWGPTNSSGSLDNAPI